MPKLIRLHDGHAAFANDTFAAVEGEDAVPAAGGVILPLVRYKAEGQDLLDQGRNVGVLLQPEEAVEDLVDDLASLSVIALSFPKFRDGRAYTSARLLRERFGYGGEIRAVGEVLREQASFFIRCGFDAFEPSDGSSPDQWMAAAHRFRHVYQRGADDRKPAFVERIA